ncbi:MAG: hypothetical protein QOD00_1425 [Blastocatellia bacterium]|jgi:hypothetical protein|nr:hypothetical protein [Blastocatellia bacterium]
MTKRSSNSAQQRPDSTEEPRTSLALNYSTSLTVRVGLSSLAESVSRMLLGHALRYLSQPTGEAGVFAETALRRARVVESAAARNFGVTEATDEWLLDESGHHLVEALERDFNRRGLSAAQRTLEAWQAENQENAPARAEAKAREMLAELDGVRTLRDHADALDGVIERIQHTQSVIESAARAASEKYRRITEYVQNNATARTASAAPAAAPAVAGGRTMITKGYRRALAYFGYAKGEEEAAAPGLRGSFARLEREVLYAGLELAALAAEGATMSETIELLRQERTTDEELLALFANAEGEASRAASRMEASRDYGLAAGEMLINGESLTAATVGHLFGVDKDVSPAVFGRFAELRQAESIVAAIANLRTDEVNTFVGELLATCRGLTAEKMECFTVADALAALLQSGGQVNWHAKLDAAFKATAVTNFLTPAYAKFIDPQIFAAVTYAPSRLPQNNERLRESLESIRHSTHIDFDIKHDALSREQLLFYCEYFCLPLESFRFYEDGWKDFEKVKDQPRYNPHPDIHADG